MPSDTYSSELRDLMTKYKSGSLTPQELQRLRRHTEELSDDTVSALMESVPDDNIPVLSDERAGQIIDRVMLHRDGMSRFWMRVMKPFSIAAAVLIPLLIVGAFMFYDKASRFDTYRDVLSSLMVITTGDDETVSITLPDSTRINLNSASKLTYALQDFSDKGRLVSLDGNADFEVARKESSPFVVDCRNMKVRVLGTSFALEARSGADLVMLYLKQGSVEMTSDFTDDKVKVAPNQLAIFDCRTGQFSLRDVDSYNDAVAVMRNDMVFSQTPFGDMIATVEKCYGITIDYPEEPYAGKRFTGYMPSHNLNEAISIIESAFEVTLVSDGDSISFSLR